MKISAGAALATLMPKSLFGASNANGPVIGVAQGDRSKLVATAIDLLGGIDRFVKSGDVVCIKPNLSFASNTDCGATTSPDIVKQMVQLCLNAGASRIFVVDHTIQDATLCVERSRIEEAIQSRDPTARTPILRNRCTRRHRAKHDSGCEDSSGC